MTTTADVVVIGAGVIGASIAHHLAVSGARVIVLERGAIAASGATVSSAGQIRLYHPDPADAELAAHSLPTFRRWADVVGGTCGFRPTGFVFLGRPGSAAPTAAVVAALSRRGIDIRVLPVDRCRELYPGLHLGDEDVVAYEPAGGYADPGLTIRSLLTAAQRHGAVVWADDPAHALVRRGSAVAGVRSATGEIHAGQVVVANGTGAAPLLAGAAVPHALVARTVGWCLVDTAAAPREPGALPVTIDDGAGTYFRPDGSGRLLVRAVLDGATVAPGVDTVPREVVAASLGRAVRRVPALRDAPLVTTRVEREAYTPDERPMIGPVAQAPGLYVATGFSGGGFKAAPAVGEFVAAELLRGEIRDELSRYRPGRLLSAARL
ncbi:NAD(P)/FAD-dependent oxidoreductase [Symbioplanes lichenis]|uniref:NAD(P)/FAD-dependent oxidoreductase n=1 Tax=Symbioplanes lichenis TaxID=1629072 RepID=UPI0027398607|nr:FAD-binding oxidoreductase [Actinoplanes lichenis]